VQLEIQVLDAGGDLAGQHVVPVRRRRHKRGQHLRRAEGRHLSDQHAQRLGDMRNRRIPVRVGRCGEQHVLQQRLERGLHLRPCDQLLGLVAQHRVQENL
jgi:hypothetical protein